MPGGPASRLKRNSFRFESRIATTSLWMMDDWSIQFSFVDVLHRSSWIYAGLARRLPASITLH